jgi:hypothetical protein
VGGGLVWRIGRVVAGEGGWMSALDDGPGETMGQRHDTQGASGARFARAQGLHLLPNEKEDQPPTRKQKINRPSEAGGRNPSTVRAPETFGSCRRFLQLHAPGQSETPATWTGPTASNRWCFHHWGLCSVHWAF